MASRGCNLGHHTPPRGEPHNAAWAWNQESKGAAVIVVVGAALTIDVVAADVTAAAMLGLLRDREPLLRRSYPNEPTYQGYPEGGAARDPVPKAASARRCCSCSSELCSFVIVW